MLRIAAAGFLILGGVLGGIADGARAEADRPDGSPFALRRAGVMKRIGGSVAVLAGAGDPRAYVPFRQDNNFYYLTGTEVPGALLLIDGARRESVLFLPPRDRDREGWEGERLYPGPEAQRATGVDAVLDAARFGAELDRRAGAAEIFICPVPAETAAVSRDRPRRRRCPSFRPVGRPGNGEAAFERNLRDRLGPSVEIRDLAPVLDEMRRVKDAWEIALPGRPAGSGRSASGRPCKMAAPV